MSWFGKLKTWSRYPTKESTESSPGWHVLESLPILIPVFLASSGALLILMLIAGILYSALALAIAVPVGILVCKWLLPHLPTKLPGSIIERRVAIVAVLVGVAAYVGVNIYYSAETVYVYKDPGIYTNTAKIISDNADLKVFTSQVFGDNPKIAGDTAGFESPLEDPDRLYVQAPHLMPTLVGLLARVFGDGAIFWGNTLLGGVALLSVYGFARMFVKPRWALLSVWILGMSLPMVYFSRDVYTEPLTIAFLFSAASLLALADTKKHLGLWRLAGFMAAAGFMVRPDTLLPLAGLASAMFLLHLQQTYTLRQALNNASAFALGAGVSALVGFLDMLNLSWRYFGDLGKSLLQLSLLNIAVVVGGVMLLLLVKKLPALLPAFSTKTKRWAPMLGAVLVVAFFAFLASRPLWLETTKEKNNGSYVAFLQSLEGSEIEPQRNYSEISLNWIFWYLGIGAVVAGVLACSILVYRMLQGKQLRMLVLVLPFLAMGSFYFFHPQITPDQIWATRRFLPLIHPGFAVLAVFFLQWAFESRLHAKLKAPLIGVLIAWFVIGPLPNLRYGAITRENEGKRAEIAAVCDALPEDAAVLLVGVNGINMTQTIKNYCDVPAERATGPNTETLRIAAAEARGRGFEPFVLLVEDEYPSLPQGSWPTRVSDIVYPELSRTLTTPPTGVSKIHRSILIGLITEDGIITTIDGKGRPQQ